MDVPERAFGWALLPLLGALSECHFFAVDFEMSGIPTGQAASAVQGDRSRHHRQTLQERYTELKQAAEKYQILQVGLTVVKEDRTRGVYEVRPYNMYLSPLVNESLHVERDITFQSAATGFLLKQGLNLDAAFRHGIPYLSRAESIKAVATERTKRDVAKIPDIKLRSDETGKIAFVKRVRTQIQKWHDSLPRPEHIIIAADGHDFGALATLNALQKRLVHQLVRAEFPDCTTISKPGVVLVQAFDVARETTASLARWEAFENKMRTQVGLRWVWEAVLGGSLEEIDARVFMQPGAWNDLAEIAHRFATVRERLRTRARPVLVGHNVLVDLVFFVRCFLGPLPDRVDDFAKLVHRLFPVVVDTKYLATHHGEDPDRPSALADLDAEACSYEFPFIEVPHGYERYLFERPHHEAGYDSFMTARVLIKVAARLERLGMYNKDIQAAEENAKAQEKAAAGAAGPARKATASRFAHSGGYDLLDFDAAAGSSGSNSSTKKASAHSSGNLNAAPTASISNDVPMNQGLDTGPTEQASSTPLFSPPHLSSSDQQAQWTPVDQQPRAVPFPPPGLHPTPQFQPLAEPQFQPPASQRDFAEPIAQQFDRVMSEQFGSSLLSVKKDLPSIDDEEQWMAHIVERHGAHHQSPPVLHQQQQPSPRWHEQPSVHQFEQFDSHGATRPDLQQAAQGYEQASVQYGQQPSTQRYEQRSPWQNPPRTTEEMPAPTYEELFPQSFERPTVQLPTRDPVQPLANHFEQPAAQYYGQPSARPAEQPPRPQDQHASSARYQQPSVEDDVHSSDRPHERTPAFFNQQGTAHHDQQPHAQRHPELRAQHHQQPPVPPQGQQHFRPPPSPPESQGSNPFSGERPATGFPPMLPPWRSDFWRVYGNKLRVNGTNEGLLKLDPDANTTGTGAADATFKPAAKPASRPAPAAAKATASVAAAATEAPAKPKRKGRAGRTRRR